MDRKEIKEMKRVGFGWIAKAFKEVENLAYQKGFSDGQDDITNALKLVENNSQQPDVKGKTRRNGEEEVAGEVHEPVGVKRGGVTQYSSADVKLEQSEEDEVCRNCSHSKEDHQTDWDGELILGQCSFDDPACNCNNFRELEQGETKDL